MYPISIGTQHMRTTHTQAEAPDLPTPYSAVVPHYVHCFTEYLRGAGYYCTNNVKTDYQFTPPVTAWDELSDSAHWRNRPDPDQPFFAVFNPTRTHESGMWEEKTPEVEIDLATVRVPPTFPDTPRVRRSIAKMHGNIARSDQHLGELLAELEEDGLAENTIVMHWSDHGPLPRGKRWPYDSGVRVPLIVRWPTGAGNPGSVAPFEDPAGDHPAGEYTIGEPVTAATVNAAGGHMPSASPEAGGPVTSADGSHRRPPLRGFAPGSVTDRLVSTIDLGPTVLALAGLPVPTHLQGRVFLGPQATAERDYVFFSRDRYDTSYDMIRAARDRRFKYLRHFYPLEPYNIWLPYRNRHPIMQELYDGYRRGTLSGDQPALFGRRPAEELYDTAVDPYELRNLADDPEHRRTLSRLREATEAWRREVGDASERSESEMVRSWYPDGRRPTTAHPIFIPFADDVYGETDITEGTLRGDAILQLQCATQGASIAWRYDDDAPDRWRLYAQPIRLVRGRTVVHGKAIRIGYEESATVTARITVEEPG
jgi:arylsulfatase A-like enzyme